jgi:multidrug transporter EmrE-like cation transporter
VLTVLAGMILRRELLDGARVMGIILVISGILIINLFSRVAAH